jgi:dUTP pyrophosphatase
LVNHSSNSFKVENGDRIAQIVFSRFEKISFKQVETLTETKRGNGGFGHTGKE